MDGIYPYVTRQMGLVHELDTLAQNIANATTPGYKAEALTFVEHVTAPNEDGPSLSMGHAKVRWTDLAGGGMRQTGGTYDMAVEGEGFFQIAGPGGQTLLTRSGAFVTDAIGTLMTHDGLPLLDLGGAPIQVPDGEGAVMVGRDGTLSKNGEPFAQVGLVTVPDTIGLQRVGDTRFRYAPPGGGVPDPVETPRIMQGFLEQSNVQSMREIARLIHVEKAYAAGQSIMDREDERMRAMLRIMETR